MEGQSFYKPTVLLGAFELDKTAKLLLPLINSNGHPFPGGLQFVQGLIWIYSYSFLFVSIPLISFNVWRNVS